MKKNKFLKLNLQLFAEGGGDGGTASGTGVSSSPGSTDGVTPAEGITEDVQTADAQAIDDREARFKASYEEFKDLYDKKTSETVQKRLRSTKDTVDRYNALAPTLDILSRKYGVDASDIEALNKAIEEDDSYFEEEALEKGIPVEQLKNIRKIERENADLKRQMQEAEMKEQSDKILAGWMNQAEALKEVYPNFALEVEMGNPRFTDLLRNNIDVRTAYEVIHKDEIIGGAMQFTANKVQEKIAKSIQANGQRPVENGINDMSSAVTKVDVSQLSRDERRKINERVARGERITF